MSKKLAILGGLPVRKEFLPYGHQWIDDDDIKAVSDVLKTDWITQGLKVAEFEKRLQNTVIQSTLLLFHPELLHYMQLHMFQVSTKEMK